MLKESEKSSELAYGLKVQSFLTEIEHLYSNLFGVTGGSFMYVEDEGLRFANNLYEEKYPDKFTEARKLSKEIESKKLAIARLLSDDCDDCDDDF